MGKLQLIRGTVVAVTVERGNAAGLLRNEVQLYNRSRETLLADG